MMLQPQERVQLNTLRGLRQHVNSELGPVIVNEPMVCLERNCWGNIRPGCSKAETNKN